MNLKRYIDSCVKRYIRFYIDSDDEDYIDPTDVGHKLDRLVGLFLSTFYKHKSVDSSLYDKANEHLRAADHYTWNNDGTSKRTKENLLKAKVLVKRLEQEVISSGIDSSDKSNVSRNTSTILQTISQILTHEWFR